MWNKFLNETNERKLSCRFIDYEWNAGRSCPCFACYDSLYWLFACNFDASCNGIDLFLHSFTLIITHSTNYESVYDAIVDHFHSRRSGIVYNTMMAISNSFTLITYFTLICKQVEGYDVTDGFVGPMIFGFLLLTVSENYLHLGEKVMRIGFISNLIISYSFFICS